MKRLWIRWGLLAVALAALVTVAQAAQPKAKAAARKPAKKTAAVKKAPESAAVKKARMLGTKTKNKVHKTASGLEYIDVKQGKGAPARAGDTVSMNYTGWLVDGKKFDSSFDRRQPFEFVLGRGEVIPGWDQGIVGMKPGGVRKLIIPPNLAYGPAGHPPVIPPNSTLIFEVQYLGKR